MSTPTSTGCPMSKPPTTPIEIIQEQLNDLKESEFLETFIRNAVWCVGVLFAIAAFVVIMVFVTTLLYAVIGGWAIGIGAIVTLGVLIAGVCTAVEQI